MRFSKDVVFANSLLSMEYLESDLLSDLQKCEQMQRVGDKCLLFSGLFPQQAESRHVKVSYFISLGCSAYLQCAHTALGSTQDLYQSLSQAFLELREVLQATRPDQALSCLANLELWEDTGNLEAYRSLLSRFKAIRSFAL